MATAADIADAILASGPRVLLLFDYLNDPVLNQLPSDTDSCLRLPRGKKLAILASVRPGWLLAADAYVHDVFDIVEMNQPSDHADNVRDAIILATAPTAVMQLGIADIAAACGARPIITLLIAEEIERRIIAGKAFGLLPVAGARQGDLLRWLERRLDEDHLLTPSPESPFSDPTPASELQACTAMTAACPQPSKEVAASGSRVLNGDTERANHIITVLQSMGWVVEATEGLAVVHDIVNDHLMQGVLLRPGSGAVRTHVADRVLEGALHRGRSVGRYSNNLSRFLRDLHLDELDEALDNYCRAWAGIHAQSIGELLAETSGEGGYALGAVLDNPAWGAAAVEHWDLILEPWLTQHGQTPSARHLYYKGLCTVQNERAAVLIRQSLLWLGRYSASPEASFVLRALLERADLAPDDAAAAARHALTWLDTHHTTPQPSLSCHHCSAGEICLPPTRPPPHARP